MLPLFRAARRLSLFMLICLIVSTLPPVDVTAKSSRRPMTPPLIPAAPVAQPSNIAGIEPQVVIPFAEEDIEQQHTPVDAPPVPKPTIVWSDVVTTFNSPPTWWSMPHVVMDADDQLHAIFIGDATGTGETATGDLYYMAGPLSETGSRVLVASGIPAGRAGYQPRIAVDDGGGVHVVWITRTDTSKSMNYRYCAGNCLNEANWAAPVYFPPTSGACPYYPVHPSIVAWGSGANRRVVLAYEGTSASGNRVWITACEGDDCNQESTWRRAISPHFQGQGSAPVLALGPERPDPLLHLLFREAGTGLNYARSTDTYTSWSLVVLARLVHNYSYLDTSNSRVNSYALTIDPDGIVYAAWPELKSLGGPEEPVYRRCAELCNVPQSWSVPASLARSEQAPPLPRAMLTITPSSVVTQTETFTGFVGLRLHPTEAPLRVTALGRFNGTGSDQAHDLLLVRADTGEQVAQATVDLNNTAARENSFAYAALTEPVTLEVGITYDLVSQEAPSGDAWYESVVQPRPGIEVLGAVQGTTPQAVTFTDSANMALGPLALLYDSARDGPPVMYEPEQGLRGDYYRSADLQTVLYTRTDRGVNFNWQESPIPDVVPVDAFGVRWAGQIVGAITGDYTFAITVTGGVRVTFDGRNVVDSWDESVTRTLTWDQTLTDGVGRSLQIDYKATAGDNRVQLAWQPPGATGLTSIPTSALRPDRLTNPTMEHDIRLAVASDGQVGALWRQLEPPTNPNEVRLLWSTLTVSETWDLPTILSRTDYVLPPSGTVPPRDLRNPDVSFDTDGTSHVTWTELNGDARDNYLTGQFIEDIPAIPADQMLVQEPCDDMAQGAKCVHAFQGDPVDTFTGNFTHQYEDFTLPTAGEPLSFVRAYNSLAAERAGPLGFGWTHSFNTRLTMTGMPGSEENRVIVEMPFGSRLRFTRQPDGSFQPFPGGFGQLVQEADQTYTLTGRDQSRWRFDWVGRLIARQNARGHTLYMNYYGSPTQVRACPAEGQADLLLCNVVDESGQRYLEFRYDAAARIDTVRDPLGRAMRYTYSDDGNLTRALLDDGTTEQTIESYTYLALHRLSRIFRHGSVAIVENTYDRLGRITSQVVEGRTTITYAYAQGADELATTVEQRGQDGTSDVVVDVYRPDGTLKRRIHNGQQVQYLTFDANLAFSSTTDANGYTTLVSANDLGQPVSVTNPLNQVTTLTYDARDRMETATDPLGRTIRFVYDNQNIVRAIEQGVVGTESPQATTLITTNVRYPGRNLIEEVQDATGAVTRFSYNDAGDVTDIEQGYGTPEVSHTRREYDAAGRMVAETLAYDTPAARTTRIEYNPDNTVARVIENFQDGTFNAESPDEDIITRYVYTNQLLEETIHPNDTRTLVTYYPGTTLVQSIRFDSNVDPIDFDPRYPDDDVATFYSYDGLSRASLITETGLLTGTLQATNPPIFSAAETRTTRIEYDAWSRPITVTLNYRPNWPADAATNVQLLTRYDAVGNQIASRDALGRWTEISYDRLNRPIRVTANVDDRDPTTGDTAFDQIMTFTYDAAGRLEQQITNYVDGTFDQREPDQDRITRFTYNDLDYLTRQIVNYADGDPASDDVDSDLIFTITPDALGRTTALTDPLGRQTIWRYDALGRVVTQIDNYQDGVHSESDLPDVDIITTAGYNALGQTVAMTDAVGLVTRYGYDGMGRLAEEVVNAQPDGPTDRETNVTTRYSYNAIGALVAMTDPRGVVTTYTVDRLGRTIGSSDADNSRLSFTYDGLGTLRAFQEGANAPTVIQTDPLGRPTATIQAYVDGVTTPEERDTDLITRTVYDAAGRVTSVVNPNEISTVYRYDAADRLIGVIEHYQDGLFDPATSDADVSTRYGYDRAGNRTEVWDANESYWQTGYDALDRPTSRTDPLNRQATLVYDRGGRLDSITRAAGEVIDFGYDAADRPTSIIYPDPASPANTTAITYTYRVDSVRQTMGDGRGSTIYDYDALKRLTGVVDPETGTLGYRYDAAGNRDQVSYPGSPPLDYRYTDGGRLRSVRQGDDTLVSYGYRFGDGRVSEEYLAQATMRLLIDYDQAMRISDIAEENGPARFRTTYDRAGRPIAQEETLETADGSISSIRSLTYDNLGRLMGAQDTPGARYAYAYDMVGNRISATVDGGTTTRTYDAAHQVAGWTYDANGRLLDDGTQTYRYDALDRLLGTSDGSTATNYAYNGDGDLIAASTAGTTTRYTQDVGTPLSRIVQTTRDDVTTDYIYGLGSGPLMARNAAGTTNYARDQLGSLRQGRDGDGTATAALRYDPWGVSHADAPAPFGFTGELHDTTAGLVHLRARWYNPSHGTFLSPDPFAGLASQPTSLHPYQYALNNPLQYTDPSGEFVPVLVGAILLGAMIGGGLEYGTQVSGNHQRGVRGWDAWTAICWGSVGIAALGGGTAAAVSFVAGPWLAATLGTGLRGTILAGLIEGSLSDVAATAVMQRVTGRAITAETLVRAAMVGLAGGAVGAGLEWLVRGGRRVLPLGAWSDDVGRAGGVRRQVRLIGFRGIGFNPTRYSDPLLQNEDALIKAGHIGISFDDGQTIYGFHPTGAALDEADKFAMAGALGHLAEGGALRGMIYDDTALFHRAHELSLSGQETSVFQIIFEVSNEEYTRIEQSFRIQYEAGEHLHGWYRFPSRDGSSMPPECNNCATWPRAVGLPIPEHTGQLRDYVPLLRDYGIPWP